MFKGAIILRGFSIALFMLVFAACAKAQDAPISTNLFDGSWENDSGSLVTFEVKDGEVHGTYQTNVGQPDKNQSFALIGFVQGDQITFTVNFKGFGSMTAWTGQLITDKNDKPYIRTLWHLTRDVADDKEQDDIWKSINTGASNFVRVS